MTTLAELAPFLGRFHPLVVHLPIGFLVALAVIAVCFRRATVKAPERVLLALLAVSCALAALLGWLLAADGGYNPDILFRHRWLGIGVAAGSLACLVLHCLSRFKAYLVVLLVTLLGVGLVGHDGGSLTHGSDYLFRYMPNPMRVLIGMEPRDDTPPVEIVAVADAPVYEAIVRPILFENCMSCHNADRSRGGLRMDTFEGILAGGVEGPLVLPDRPMRSPLLTRIYLPADDEKHMPPPGKTPLTPDQKEVLRWWVEAGAPFEGTVAEVDAGSGTEVMLEEYLGLAEPAPAPRPLGEIAADARRLVETLGIHIEPLAESHDGVEVNVQNVASAFGDEGLAQLEPIAANVVALNLTGSDVTDAGLAVVGGMVNLEKLWLNGTAITDQGLADLVRLRELRYLNLYGTQVSDAGLPKLAALPKLKRLYLWQTGVTPQAAADFASRSIDQRQLETWRQEIAKREKLIEQAGTRVELGLDVQLGDQTEEEAATH
ncbi:MAG: c-type cytochrome domain-containing protein [Planctomycetota bacterium]